MSAAPDICERGGALVNGVTRADGNRHQALRNELDKPAEPWPVGGDHNLLDSDVPLRLRRVGGDNSQLAAIPPGSQRIRGPGWHHVDRCVQPGPCQRLQLLGPIRLAMVHDRRGTCAATRPALLSLAVAITVAPR
jgi:hypothetical protein